MRLNEQEHKERLTKYLKQMREAADAEYVAELKQMQERVEAHYIECQKNTKRGLGIDDDRWQTAMQGYENDIRELIRKELSPPAGMTATKRYKPTSTILT